MEQLAKPVMYNYVKTVTCEKVLIFSWNASLELSCSASEVCHPSEVGHLHFMTRLNSFYCPVTAYMYTLPLKEAIPFI